jgi:hypothetical protein
MPRKKYVFAFAGLVSLSLAVYLVSGSRDEMVGFRDFDFRTETILKQQRQILCPKTMDC